MSLSYEKAGVSIDTADAAKKKMAEAMSTRDPHVLHRAGAFAALYDISDLSARGYQQPVLVMKTEEPGSKQKLAFQHNRPAGIAQDMIHHLIDDIIVVGARPLIVQDCVVCGKLQKDVVLQLVQAMNDACRANDCLLVGGETSEQPGVLEEGAYILSSSVVGVVEKDRIIDGSKIQKGDVILAVPSNGLHTNGYSLVRALIKEHPALIHGQVPMGLASPTFLDAILKPHTCYYPAFKGLFANPAIAAGLHGIAHITGGGIAGNLDRVLPAGVSAAVDLGKLRVLPLFKRIQQLGNVPEADMLRTFNMGVGMTLVVAPGIVQEVVAHLAGQMLEAYPIGTIVEGDQTVRYSGAVKW